MIQCLDKFWPFNKTTVFDLKVFIVYNIYKGSGTSSYNLRVLPLIT